MNATNATPAGTYKRQSYVFRYTKAAPSIRFQKRPICPGSQRLHKALTSAVLNQVPSRYAVQALSSARSLALYFVSITEQLELQARAARVNSAGKFSVLFLHIPLSVVENKLGCTFFIPHYNQTKNCIISHCHLH